MCCTPTIAFVLCVLCALCGFFLLSAGNKPRRTPRTPRTAIPATHTNPFSEEKSRSFDRSFQSKLSSAIEVLSFIKIPRAVTTG